VIRRFNVIQGTGTFFNYRPGGADSNPEFGKHTIVYAFNGYGKSTLAAILKSLSSDDPSRIIERPSLMENKKEPPEQEIVIIYDKGNSCFQKKKWQHNDAVTPEIIVFDQEFIFENLFVREVEVDNKKNMHRIVIGDRGIKLSSELSEAKEHEKRFRKDFDVMENELNDR